MISVRGNDFWRGSEKIGYIVGNDIKSHDGRKLGYFEDNHIYNHDGRKIGYLRGNEIRALPDDELVAHIDENRSHVSGGALSDLARAAVRLLLGD